MTLNCRSSDAEFRARYTSAFGQLKRHHPDLENDIMAFIVRRRSNVIGAVSAI